MQVKWCETSHHLTLLNPTFLKWASNRVPHNPHKCAPSLQGICTAAHIVLKLGVGAHFWDAAPVQSPLCRGCHSAQSMILPLTTTDTVPKGAEASYLGHCGDAAMHSFLPSCILADVCIPTALSTLQGILFHCSHESSHSNYQKLVEDF